MWCLQFHDWKRDLRELSERSADEIVELQKINDSLKFMRNKLEKYKKQLEEYEVNNLTSFLGFPIDSKFYFSFELLKAKGVKSVDPKKTHEVIAADYEASFLLYLNVK